MALVRVAVAPSPLAWTITAPVLLLALRRAADVAVFSPVSRFFRASLGTSGRRGAWAPCISNILGL